jgi:hypothetical protein
MEQPSTKRLVAAGVTLAVDALTAEVANALSHSGVRAILLKGPSVISWLYGEHPERYSVDVDLLVAPQQLRQAERVLTELGFKPFEPAREERHALMWLRGEAGPSVDLHRALVGIGVSDDEAWNVLSRDVERLRVSGSPVEVLSPAGRALHVALHAAQQGVETKQSMMDVARAAEALPLELWQDAAALAERLKATPALAAGLRLVPLGREIADQLGLPSWKPPEVSLRERTAPDLTLTLNRLMETTGLRRKVSLAFRRAFPPKDLMRTRSALARRGRGGLAAAYAWRAAWLALRLGPAVRHVLTARRDSRRMANKAT